MAGTTFTKKTEQYIQHEVQLRLNNKQFQHLDKTIERLESNIKHLDNKLMLMFSIVLGSIWLPVILHYPHLA